MALYTASFFSPFDCFYEITHTSVLVQVEKKTLGNMAFFISVLDLQLFFVVAYSFQFSMPRLGSLSLSLGRVEAADQIRAFFPRRDESKRVFVCCCCRPLKCDPYTRIRLIPLRTAGQKSAESLVILVYKSQHNNAW